ncbi:MULTISPECIES: hypothetical protein [Acinetobacter]|jgi:hypothetical protein|uniref:Uncharacterized protein n=1 Tax=Acinetobacter baumannii TaxID=470 RepID=A0A0J8WBH4_ACIBA|nr:MULTISPECIES: hypothetical protein [Acinetobacter]AKQ32620.1 hypothetical protein ACX61_19720 [Acinetobacter baumannii]ALG88286.1 hypothetical protein [Acinetobacter baumannii]AMQ95696.1 hypothetical protein [Acinetobacter baumannii]ASS85435.1 hypothetical protein [Acinetobacter baumannii]EHU1275423.1 hypothetical protein [Acinetobacter baumannii]
MNANHYIQLAREFRKFNSEPILASQKIEHLARYMKLHPKIGAYEDYIRNLPLGSRLPRGKYFKGRKAGDNIRAMDEYWNMIKEPTIRSTNAKIRSLNPVASFKTQYDSTMIFLQRVANYTLNSAQSQRAKSLILDTPDGFETTILSVVQLWEKDALLKDFATALKLVALPN